MSPLSNASKAKSDASLYSLLTRCCSILLMTSPSSELPPSKSKLFWYCSPAILSASVLDLSLVHCDILKSGFNLFCSSKKL